MLSMSTSIRILTTCSDGYFLFDYLVLAVVKRLQCHRKLQAPYRTTLGVPKDPTLQTLPGLSLPLELSLEWCLQVTVVDRYLK